MTGEAICTGCGLTLHLTHDEWRGLGDHYVLTSCSTCGKGGAGQAEPCSCVDTFYGGPQGSWCGEFRWRPAVAP